MYALKWLPSSCLIPMASFSFFYQPTHINTIYDFYFKSLILVQWTPILMSLMGCLQIVKWRLRCVPHWHAITLSIVQIVNRANISDKTLIRIIVDMLYLLLWTTVDIWARRSLKVKLEVSHACVFQGLLQRKKLSLVLF